MVVANILLAALSFEVISFVEIKAHSLGGLRLDHCDIVPMLVMYRAASSCQSGSSLRKNEIFEATAKSRAIFDASSFFGNGFICCKSLLAASSTTMLLR